MTMKIASVASVLGALMVSGGLATAADLPARVEPAPIFTTVSGYVEAGVGIGWARNSSTSSYNYGSGGLSSSASGRDSTWSISGAGRANVWLSPSFSMQTDIWGSAESAKIKNCTGCGSSNATAFNIGSHLSYRDPNAFLVGVYGALGSFNTGYSGSGDSANHGTIGLEGQVYFGATTLYAQAGYASTISASDYASANAWNARGVLRHYINPNLRISGELGYAHLDFDNNNNNYWGGGSSSAHQVNWGVGVENKFGTSPFSAFLKYEGTDTQFKSSGVPCCSYTNLAQSSDKTTSHSIKAGFRVYFNEGTLLANDRNGTTLDIRDPISTIGRGFGVNFDSNSNLR
ncbi:MAG: hypothetical protein JWM36_3884 [Hyphomicrobiales bacterium]|nr:hypothetical protein [Hyphomicrobiales bacterium]